MADNVNITAGAGTVIATDQVGVDHFQKIKLADGTDNSSTMIVAGGGVEAAALRVTLASDSTGVVSVDDNGGALTVDGTVAVTNAGITSIDGKITACNTGAVILASGTVTAVTAITNALPAGTALLGKVSIDQVTASANEVVVKSITAGNNNIGDVDVASIAAGDNNIGNVDIVTVPAPLSVVGTGTEATALRVTIASDSTGVLSVDDNAGSLTVDNAALAVVGGGVEATAMRVTLASDSTGLVSVDDNAGSLTVDNATLAVVGGGAEATALRVTLANDSTGVVTVDGTVTASNTAGDIASDAEDSGNPVKVGGKAVNMDGTVPGTAVAENDRANFITDIYGRQCVETVHPNFWSVAANYSEAQTAVEVKAAPGAGLSLYITDVICSNGATAGNMKFGEDTAALADKIEVMYFAINGGAALHFRTPIKLTANKNFGLTSVTCTTHSVTICGYTAP